MAGNSFEVGDEGESDERGEVWNLWWKLPVVAREEFAIAPHRVTR